MASRGSGRGRSMRSSLNFATHKRKDQSRQEERGRGDPKKKKKKKGRSMNALTFTDLLIIARGWQAGVISREELQSPSPSLASLRDVTHALLFFFSPGVASRKKTYFK